MNIQPCGQDDVILPRPCRWMVTKVIRERILPAQPLAELVMVPKFENRAVFAAFIDIGYALQLFGQYRTLLPISWSVPRRA